MNHRRPPAPEHDGDAAWAARARPARGQRSIPPYLVQAVAEAARHSLRRLLPPLTGGPLQTLTGTDVMLSPAQVVRGVIRSDPLLAAQALAVANMMRRKRLADAEPVVDVEGAVSELGLDGCRTLLETAVVTARPLPAPLEEPGERLAAHAMAVAHEARQLAREGGLPAGGAYVGGLLSVLGPALMLVGLSRLMRIPDARSLVTAVGIEPVIRHPVAADLTRDLVHLWRLPRALGDCVIGGTGGTDSPGGLAVVVARAEATVRDGIGSRLGPPPGEEIAVGGPAGGGRADLRSVGEA